MFDISAYSGYPRYPKVWGEEIWLINSPLYCAKLLLLAPGMQCSKHRHMVKTETFFVLQGLVQIELGPTGHQECKGPGDSVHIPVGTYHRFSDPYESHLNDPIIILEVSSHHDDADVERLEESGPCQ